MKSAKVVKSGQSARGADGAARSAGQANDAPVSGGTAGEAQPTTRALSPARIRDIVLVVAGLLAIALDQWTKHLVVSYFVTPGYRAPVPIFGDILTLDYVQNTGVAFSLFEGNNVEFVLIAIAIAVIAYLYWRYRESASLALKLAFGFVLGGAIGNLIDRFRQGYVVDFIHFQLPAINFNFAVFNFADSCISVGVIAIAVLLYFNAGQDEALTKQAAAASASTDVAANPATTTPASAKASADAPLAPKASASVASGSKSRPAAGGASSGNGGSASARAKGGSGANSPRARRKAAGGQRRG